MNWVSKTQYLERRIKKLEKENENLKNNLDDVISRLDLITDHMQVDEDGNIVIEANTFNVSSDGNIKIKSFDNLEINGKSTNIYANESDINIKTIGMSGMDSGNINITTTASEISITSIEGDGTSGVVSIGGGDVLIFGRGGTTADGNVEIIPQNKFTSTKALEVVE